MKRSSLTKEKQNGKSKPIKEGAKKSKSDWGKKAKSKDTETKEGKFQWIKNLFGKSGSEKKEDKK